MATRVSIPQPRAQVYGKEAPSVTIDTKEFLPAAPKGSGDEEAMGRCAAFLLQF